VVEPLVVIVDGDRQHALGVVLADHVIVEDGANLHRRRHAVARLHQRALVLLADDVHAKLDAFIADEHGRSGNQLADFVLALPAEGAVEGVLGIGSTHLAHSIIQLSFVRWCRGESLSGAMGRSCRLASEISP
jgi:hypothetical protein